MSSTWASQFYSFIFKEEDLKIHNIKKYMIFIPDTKLKRKFSPKTT